MTADMTKVPFDDPSSGESMTAHFGAAPGIEHPGCIYRAEVSPALDAFMCMECGRTGRIDGAWFVALLERYDVIEVRAGHDGPCSFTEGQCCRCGMLEL